MHRTHKTCAQRLLRSSSRRGSSTGAGRSAAQHAGPRPPPPASPPTRRTRPARHEERVGVDRLHGEQLVAKHGLAQRPRQQGLPVDRGRGARRDGGDLESGGHEYHAAEKLWDWTGEDGAPHSLSATFSTFPTPCTACPALSEPDVLEAVDCQLDAAHALRRQRRARQHHRRRHRRAGQGACVHAEASRVEASQGASTDTTPLLHARCSAPQHGYNPIPTLPPPL